MLSSSVLYFYFLFSTQLKLDFKRILQDIRETEETEKNRVGNESRDNIMGWDRTNYFDNLKQSCVMFLETMFTLLQFTI